MKDNALKVDGKVGCEDCGGIGWIIYPNSDEDIRCPKCALREAEDKGEAQGDQEREERNNK